MSTTELGLETTLAKQGRIGRTPFLLFTGGKGGVGLCYIHKTNEALLSIAPPLMMLGSVQWSSLSCVKFAIGAMNGLKIRCACPFQYVTVSHTIAAEWIQCQTRDGSNHPTR